MTTNLMGPRTHTQWQVTKPAYRVSRGQLGILTRQLASLLRSGMSIVPALSAIYEQLDCSGLALGRAKDLKALVGQLRSRVNAGWSLSDAMAEHPDVFEPSFVAVVAAAEASGSIDQALVDLAQRMEERQNLQMQLIIAIAYPAFITLVAIAVVIFMLIYVLPGLGQIFDEMHLVIPWPTRVLMGAGYLLRSYGLVAAAGILVLVVGLLTAYTTGHGKQTLDEFLVSIPLISRLVMKAQLAQMAVTLSSLLSSGLPLPTALRMAADTLTNSRIRRAWEQVTNQVCEGQTLAAAVRNVGLFPPLFYHILAVAEDTGTFEGSLSELAEMYRRELQTASKVIVGLLEPVILLVMGIIVGWIVMAVLLPIFSLNQTLG